MTTAQKRLIDYISILVFISVVLFVANEIFYNLDFNYFEQHEAELTTVDSSPGGSVYHYAETPFGMSFKIINWLYILIPALVTIFLRIRFMMKEKEYSLGMYIPYSLMIITAIEGIYATYTSYEKGMVAMLLFYLILIYIGMIIGISEMILRSAYYQKRYTRCN